MVTIFLSHAYQPPQLDPTDVAEAHRQIAQLASECLESSPCLFHFFQGGFRAYPKRGADPDSHRLRVNDTGASREYEVSTGRPEGSPHSSGSRRPRARTASRPYGPGCRIQLGEDADTILIVDNDTAFRSQLKKMLETGLYWITIAETVDEGLKLLQGSVIDCVICDAGGEVAQGLEMVRNCKDNPELAHVPIIVLRGESISPSLLDCLAAGADDCVPKAMSATEEIVARVKGLIANRRRVYSWVRRIGQALSPDHLRLPWCIDTSGLSADDAAFVTKIENEIRIGCCDPGFSAAALANNLHCERRTFQRKCKKMVGTSPNALIRFARLVETWKSLLRGACVKSAALKAGFRLYSEIKKDFVDLFGITPAALKARVANGGC